MVLNYVIIFFFIGLFVVEFLSIIRFSILLVVWMVKFMVMLVFIDNFLIKKCCIFK